MFEATVELGADPVAAANWITQDLAGLANKHGANAAARVTPQHLADLLEMLGDDSISGTGAKQALEEAAETGDAIETIVERTGLRQVSDSGELGSIVDGCSPRTLTRRRSSATGTSVIGFLVGQVMKASGGSANPKLAPELLRERLQG